MIVTLEVVMDVPHVSPTMADDVAKDLRAWVKTVMDGRVLALTVKRSEA